MIPGEQDAQEAPEHSEFRGLLEAYYVGTPLGAGAGDFGDGQRYQLRIYRGTVRNAQVVEDRMPVLPGERVLYQDRVDDVRIFGLRPRTCLEGAVYDVAVSGFQITHSTHKGKKTYGRLVGEVSGRCLVPPVIPVSEPEEMVARQEPVPRNEREALVDSSQEDALEAPLHPPRPQKEAAPTPVPIALLAVLAAIALGLTSGGEATLLWIGLFIPIAVIRFMLTGLFHVNTGQRVVGGVFILAQLVFIGIVIFRYSLGGCESLPMWALGAVAGCTLLASVLPVATPLLVTGVGFAVVLFLFYADVGWECAASPEELEDAPRKPSVQHPGTPRTNPDGSWPRRMPPSP